MCTGSFFIQMNSFRRLHCKVRNEWAVWMRTSVWEGCRLRNKPNTLSSSLPFTLYTSSQAVARSGCPLIRQTAGGCHWTVIVRNLYQRAILQLWTILLCCDTCIQSSIVAEFFFHKESRFGMSKFEYGFWKSHLLRWPASWKSVEEDWNSPWSGLIIGLNGSQQQSLG